MDNNRSLMFLFFGALPLYGALAVACECLSLCVCVSLGWGTCLCRQSCLLLS